MVCEFCDNPFYVNIVYLFHRKDLNDIRKAKDELRVKIQKDLESGNYNIVNCLGYTKDDELVEFSEQNMQIVRIAHSNKNLNKNLNNVETLTLSEAINKYGE